MNLGNRLKDLRRNLGLSQEALGAQGIVSTPGWIKIENCQRQASEKLIERLVDWLVADKHIRAGTASVLKQELLTLKYLGSRSPFMRELAKAHARTLPEGETLLAATPDRFKPVRGRPRKYTASDVALVAETPDGYKVQRGRRSSSRK